MKKLTYGNQITLGIVQLILCHVLAHLLGRGWIINIGWIVYGLLFIIHPVYPKRAEGHPKIKKYVRIAGCMIILFGLMLRNNLDTDLTSEQLHLDVTGGSVVSSFNDYGGFHGDGTRFEVRTFSDDQVLKEIQAHPQWFPLPLTENLEIVVYGKEFPGYSMGPFIGGNGAVAFPEIENGYYYFYDRKSDSVSDKDVLNRGSFNYTLAIYDTDSHTLYFCNCDT